VSTSRAETILQTSAQRTGAAAVSGPWLVGLMLLGVALVVGIATAADYGFTVDEFNTNDYGPKALAWYTSGFTDSSHFYTVEPWLWAYGPWFQILIAMVQSLDRFDPITVRHAMTFTVGLVGLAALLPLARETVGRWAGPVALLLCLITGNLYGSLFFAPIDVPFMAAMTWATLSLVNMARHTVPTWTATLIAGLATGLAIATRTGGIITHAYLLGAMTLCALEVIARGGPLAWRQLTQIALRTLGVVIVAWLVAYALWPYLQVGNPFTQFAIAYEHFRTIGLSFSFMHWGEPISTTDLPSSYVPAQYLARLPEIFLVLLAAGAVIGIWRAAAFVQTVSALVHRFGALGLRVSAIQIAQQRGTLIIVAAALAPIAFVILQGSTMYDGVRHLMFVVPMLALLAGGACIRMLQWLSVSRTATLAVSALALAAAGLNVQTLAALHPLQYVAMNSLAGGVAGAQGRFELDYLSAAATEALRRLEQRLATDPSGRFTTQPARLLVCIPYRETMMEPLYRRHWVLETDPRKADFIIETERSACGNNTLGMALIDQVDRLGATFAWTYAHDRGRTD